MLHLPPLNEDEDNVIVSYTFIFMCYDRHFENNLFNTLIILSSLFRKDNFYICHNGKACPVVILCYDMDIWKELLE